MKNKFSKKLISVFLCIALIMTYLPITTMAASAGTHYTVSDPGTADAWEDIMGTTADGNRYAGRVWVDKSVYTDGDTVTLNRDGDANSTFTVDVDEASGEYFQVVFSALGSSMTTTETAIASKPMDVVIVLDNSDSMQNSSRMQETIEAANRLLEDMLKNSDVRVGITTYEEYAATVLPFGRYTNGIELRFDRNGVITAYDNDGNVIDSRYKSNGYELNTNIQAGFELGMEMLATATDTTGRKPVAILLTDGAANTAVDTLFNGNAKGDTHQIYYSNNIAPAIALSTLLSNAYNKAVVEKHYGVAPVVYGIGVDLSNSDGSNAIINPKANFNSSNSNSNIRSAYNTYVNTWLQGSNVEITTGSSWSGVKWFFGHSYPSGSNITDADIEKNINYVDTYYSASSADLEAVFDQIYEELYTGAFNPISTTKNGATGVEDTPLIYVDNIGKYMEVRDIQALQVFGQTFQIVKNGDDVYSVAEGSGVNPTTKESWNTAGDIDINILYNDDGTQQLRIYIDQEILPILLDEINVKTEDNITTRTLEEYSYPPLRIYYTVGIDNDILLPSGEVNPAMIDGDYAFLNADGTADFYSNAFGVMNKTNEDGDAFVDEGDAHVGFIPSHDNRYYYHQAHQEVFIEATNSDGSPIDWEDDMYGVRWVEGRYKVKAMTYEDVADIDDTDRVYTYVTFTSPTGNGIEAEEVTYLVYMTWGEVKSAVTFHDKINNTNLNNGEAISFDDVNSVVGSYLSSNSGVNASELITILGIDSRRVSRLHHMFETKVENITATAETSYAPEYNNHAHETGDLHEHSEVIVWLGNNGKLTLPVASGIKITKDLTEVADGAAADEIFTIYTRLNNDAQNVGNIFVADENGDALPANKYDVSVDGNDVLVTLYLANNECAVIMGASNGTVFSVTEASHDKYKYTYDGATVAVAGEVLDGVVTNSPILSGTLFITKEVEHAYGGEEFPKNHKFDFNVTFIDANGAPIANSVFHSEDGTEFTTNSDGEISLRLQHGETIHILDIPVGATVTVEEINIPANYTKTEYESRDHSGIDADNDGVVTVDEGQNATVVVKNIYKPDKVDVDISFSGTKNFDATQISVDSEFTFKLQEYTNGIWTEVEGKSVTVVKGENASEAFAFSPLSLEFDTPGVHSYQIIEVKGDNTDITYDRSVYTFSVNVTINADGDLQAEVVGHNEKENVFEVSGDNTSGYEVNTVFTNYYHKTAASIAIKKEIEDKANSGKTSADFVIETYEASVDANGNWILGDFINSTVTDAQGEALLVHNYDNTDFVQNDTDNDNQVTYHYVIKEKDTKLNGWKYDATEYRVTVTLTKAIDESISADFDIVKVVDEQNTDLGVNGDSATITFSNTYEPKAAEVNLNVTPTVLKEMDGRALKSGEFTFAIFENGVAVLDANGMLTNIEDAIATGTNDAQGNVTFAPVSLNFSQIGKYAYDVIEVKGSLEGVTYDPTIYDLVVEISDDESGALKAEYYFEDSITKQVTFHNAYTVEPVEVVISGIKTLKVNNGNKTMQAGDYTFGLFDALGAKIDETENLADGTFDFGAIEYDTDDIGKTYTYTVREIAPDGSTDGTYKDKGVTWSGQSFDVTVNISDNGDGTVTANVTNNGSQNIVFENIYESKPASVILNGKKHLENRTLAEGEFTFTLYGTDRNFESLTPIDNDITHDINGDFSVDFGTLQEGRHYFLLKENVPDVHEKGIIYSATEYHITIVVTDHGIGEMRYTEMVVNPAVPEVTDAAIEFINVYSPEPNELPLFGTKIYNGGKALEDDIFSVGLYDEENELLQTAPIKADGSFAFDNLIYQAGDVGETFVYTIKEIIPAGATDNGDGTFSLGNEIYDGAVYTLTVTVADTYKDGVLELASVLTKDGDEVDELTFTNTFVPNAITYDIVAKKTYEKGLIGDDFEFTLVSADNKTNVNQNKKNDANGDIRFDSITFSEAGTYKFIVKEVNKILSFIRYSAAEYEITITVVNGNGVLRVSDVTTENTKNSGETNLEFINIYVLDGEDEITLRGIKEITGGRTTVNAGEFEFGLYDAQGKLIESVKNDADGNFAFATLKFNELDVSVNGQKQISYTVKEIKGSDACVTYDETVYDIVVTVKDNDQGGVTASYTVNNSADGLIKFTNIYTPIAPITPTTPNPEYPNSPKTGDTTNLTLWFAVLFISGGVLGTAICGKKRKKASR